MPQRNGQDAAVRVVVAVLEAPEVDPVEVDLVEVDGGIADADGGSADADIRLDGPLVLVIQASAPEAIVRVA